MEFANSIEHSMRWKKKDVKEHMNINEHRDSDK